MSLREPEYLDMQIVQTGKKKGFTLTGRKTRVWKLISIYFISSSVPKEWWYFQNFKYNFE